MVDYKRLRLTGTEVVVLLLRGFGFSLREVSRLMGWRGKERARQVEARGLWKLREAGKLPREIRKRLILGA